MAEIKKHAPQNQKLNVSEIEKALEHISPRISKKLNKEERKELVSFAMSVQKTHVGPLPDPETLEGYARLIENGAERIMQMAERQQEHRIAIEKQAIKSQLHQSATGQTYAIIIALVFIASSLTCALFNQTVIAGILGVSGLSGIVTAFIRGRNDRDADLNSKR